MYVYIFLNHNLKINSNSLISSNIAGSIIHVHFTTLPRGAQVNLILSTANVAKEIPG